MKPSVITVISVISAVSFAFPSTKPLSRISNRNPCDGINATPILYHEYYGDTCPPIHTMDNTGVCPGLDPYKNECASFCEVRKYPSSYLAMELAFYGIYHNFIYCIL
jgi:hypothetical protein